MPATITTKTPSPYQFFKAHAGYSYDPATETPEKGRQRCAAALARAERRGSAIGLTFEWDIDPDINSSEWSDEEPAWSLWMCRCKDMDGATLASLHGIDFGRDGQPWGEPYRRVIEAELAQEALATL